MSKETFDVVILGSGIAGTTCALSLGAQGLNVLLLEAKQHPRFAIGESTVPSTSAGFKLIGERFNVPELSELTTYIKSKELGLVSYPKSHFYFAWHEPRRALRKQHELVFETYRPPLGPDTHLQRSTLDAYLVSLCDKYGVTFRERAAVRSMRRGSEREKAVLSVRYGGGGSETAIEAALVIDATGHAAFGARHAGLLDERGECDLETHTRVTYGHFAYTEQTCDLDGACGGASSSFRYRRDAGTMHHCFDGGWIWVIPFDNGSVSVGLILDCVAHPYDSSVGKDDEFWSFIDRFPTVAAHLRQLTPVRSIIRKNRIQLHTTAMAVDRLLLTPHAAAFVDPLFSTGINLTSRFVLRAVPRIVAAFARDGGASLDAARLFAPLSRSFDAELYFIDRMVWGTIQSFRSFDLFRQFWRVWIEATTRQIVDVQVDDNVDAPLYGAGDAQWRAALTAAYDIVVRESDESDAARAVALKALLDSTPSAYNHYPMKQFAPSWRIGFPHRTNVMVPMHTASMMKLVSNRTKNPLLLALWATQALLTMLWFWTRYWLSWCVNGEFARHVDQIYKQVLPVKLSSMFGVLNAALQGLLFGKSAYASKKHK